MKAKTCQNKTDNQKNLEIVLLKDTYVLLICNCVTVWYLCMWYTYVISCQTICRSVCLFLSLSPNLSVCRDLCTRTRGRYSFVDSFDRYMRFPYHLASQTRGLFSLAVHCGQTPQRRRFCYMPTIWVWCVVFVFVVAVAGIGGGGETRQQPQL